MVDSRKRSEIFGKKASETTKFVMDTVPEFRVKTKLKEILYNRKMSQADLARLTGIPPNQISAFVTNKSTARISYHHIQVLMIALRLTKVEQLLVVEMDRKTVKTFEQESLMWDTYRTEPDSIKQLYKKAITIAEENTGRSH